MVVVVGGDDIIQCARLVVVDNGAALAEGNCNDK